MICERCGNYLPDDTILCDRCGAMMNRPVRSGDVGVRAIRQGRRMAVPPPLPDETRASVPEYGDFDMSPLPVEQERGVRRGKPAAAAAPVHDLFASRPNTRRGVPVRGNVRTRQVVAKHGKAHVVSRHPINWMLIGVILTAVMIATAIGYMVYMRTSDTGQRATARKYALSANEGMLTLATSKDPLVETEKQELLKDWGSAPAQAYWLVGQEFIDMGDMPGAVMAFQIANVLDAENYDGLLLLGSALELNNQEAEAETLYRALMDTVSPSRAEAYTALINIMLKQDRNPEAADLMLLAYKNTDRENFRQQRRDFIPNTPQVDTYHLSGRYELEQHITLTSPQGYDVYYTLDDDAELPQGGTLLTEGTVTITEGTYTLRAVSVVDDLVSDVMSATYTVYYPTPAMPKCNLAPNTYSSARTVSLRAGEALNAKEARRGKTKEQLAVEDDQTFYYTIDGSLPDPAISPKFDGTPIKLPSGRVTLRAVAVNGYGKQSSTMEVGYKFDIKPYPLEMYGEGDVFAGVTLNDTTLEAFTAAFGQPASTEATTYLTMENQAQHLTYSWGYAVFVLTGGRWEAVRLEMTNSFTTAPRGVGLGSSETDITGVYKDFGMVENQNGSRNLYYDDPRIGVVLANEDGTRTVQYTCTTLAGKKWILQYHLQNGRCVKISHYYRP